MATKQPRLNVTLSDDVAAVLESLSKKEKRSMSAIALEMLQKAIDYDEDAYLCTIAEQREETPTKTLTHDEFWKRALQD